MADFFTDLGTLQNSAAADTSKAPNLRSYGGNLHEVDVKISVGAGITTADVIKLMKLPIGARIIPALCSVDYGLPAATAWTAKVGDELDDDRYGAALALGTAAGRKEFIDAGTKGVGFLTPYKTVASIWVIVTPTTLTAQAAHDQTWHIVYTLA